MMTFQVFKTKITLQFGFFAVPALVLCLGGDTYFLPSVLACVLHESGHILMAALCCIPVKEICFGMFGIHMMGEMQKVSYLRRAAVSLAGPLMGLIGFLVFLSMPPAYSAMQLILFVFHILPAVPLDGGTALHCVLCCVLSKEGAQRWSIGVSALIAFLLGVLGFSVLLRTKGNFTLLAAAVYIMIYVVLKPCGDLC